MQGWSRGQSNPENVWGRIAFIADFVGCSYVQLVLLWEQQDFQIQSERHANIDSLEIILFESDKH